MFIVVEVFQVRTQFSLNVRISARFDVLAAPMTDY